MMSLTRWLVCSLLLVGSAWAQSPLTPPAATSPSPSPAPSPELHFPRFKLSGFFQAQATGAVDANADGTRADDGFLIRRARLKLSMEVARGVAVIAMVDPSTPSNLLRDAYVSLGLIPHHELRIGQQKTLFGYENPESAAKLYVVNRALVSDALGRGRDLRDLGVGLLGNWELPASLALDYGATVVNGAGPNVLRDDTARKSLWSRAGLTWRGPGTTVRLGASYGVGDTLNRGKLDGPEDDFLQSFWRAGADLEVDSQWFLLTAEYVRGDNRSFAGLDTAHGFYVFALGKTPWQLGPLARFELYDPSFAQHGDLQRRITVGGYVDVPAWNTRLLLQYERDDSTTHRDDAFNAMAQVTF